MVDAIASLVCTDFRADEWGVDVTVAGSQKGLMMPPGMSFNAASGKARQIGESATLPRSYWDWRTRRGEHHYTWYCGTAPQQSVYGLREAIDMIMEEGLDQAFARHHRLAKMTRAAIEVWAEAGALELNALVDGEKSASVSTILVPEECDVERLHTVCRDRFNLSLGNGIGKLSGKAFRIGHMGNVNEPMIIGTIGAVEAGLDICGIPHGRGGAQAAVNAVSSMLDN
jgi:alanine-glyoxylate transaminase/serine-glyoxylate transaminase/serine-pyruvate transaminase